MRNSLFVLAVVASPFAAFAGQVLVVGPAPAPYVRIQDAINAAQPGDIVLVKSSVHDSIRISDKPLALVADTGVTIQQAGAIRVSNLRAKGLVVLSGITATGVASVNLPDLASGLVADACAGAVLVQDCTLKGYTATNLGCMTAHAGAAVQNCAAVAFTRCTIRGGALANVDAGVSLTQGAGIDALAPVNISCDSVDARGGGSGLHCNTAYPGDGAWGGSGARFLGGSLFAAGSGFVGGPGGDVLGWPTGCVTLTQGGGGGHGFESVLPTSPALFRRLDTIAQGLSGGNSCGGFMSQGPLGFATYGGIVSTIAGNARRLEGPALVRDDTLATLTFRGQAGEQVEIAVALNQAVHQFDPAQAGVLHVRNPRWRAVGDVPASGVLTSALRMPNLSPADPGAVFVVQARFVDPTTGQARLSNVHALVLVDASY